MFDVGELHPARSILKIVCGGMHTVALSNQGKVYTWGCNDEGALGREGAENMPLEVSNSLAIPVTDVSAGDSHTIAYNTELNQVYIWGLYRVSTDFLPQKHIYRMR
jgi:regulator of chromosome condensation